MAGGISSRFFCPITSFEYGQGSCGSVISIAAPDYVWDSCPNPFMTYDDFGVNRIQTWPSRVGSLSLEEDTGSGVESGYYNEPPSGDTSGQIGGIECAQFEDQFMKTPSFTSTWSQPYTIACVVKWKTVASLTQYNILDGRDTTNRATLFRSTGDVLCAFAGNSLVGSVTASTGDIQRIVCVFNGASSKLLVNGTLDSGDVGGNSLNGLSVGQRITSVGGLANWDGALAEVALWNKALSTSQMRQVERWYQTKWTVSES